MAKKRRIRKEIKYLFVVVLIITAVSAVTFGGKYIRFMDVKSVNSDAKKIINNHCLAFYPDGSNKDMKKTAEKLCDGVSDDSVFDYQKTVMGEYILIDYGNGTSYLLDSDMQNPKPGEISERGMMIISDYLRYTMKSNGLDYAYTLSFLEKSYYENIEKDSFKCTLKGMEYACHFDEYDVDVNIPLKYIGNEIGIDIKDDSKYIKPVFVDPDRKAVAITFDDGPSLNDECTNKILDELYRYDANATFYLLGNRLYDKTEGIISKGIEMGNEYGSHSCTHPNLRSLTKDEMYSEIMDVSDWLYDKFGYHMNTYRPPYGKYNETVDETIPVAAVLWDVDSNDWSYRDGQKIYDEVKKDVFNHAVIIMHDIYDTTSQALVDHGLIKELINDGYQLVTVDEIAKLRNVELKQGVHLCW